jgi:hypothetical protein
MKLGCRLRNANLLAPSSELGCMKLGLRTGNATLETPSSSRDFKKRLVAREWAPQGFGGVLLLSAWIIINEREKDQAQAAERVSFHAVI